MAAACWCGGDLTSFGDDYFGCACGTLVRSRMPSTDVTRVQDEQQDLYGKNYWFAHQAALGLPDLDQRAADDLHTRQLKWLRLVTAYTSAPGRVLEIGAGHGGFLSLMEMCGFDVTGIELSPWVVDYAKRTSGVRMLLGPLEDQPLEERSFDVILLFDVLEHLPDPLGTITRCAQLLRDDGVLIIQTPCRPAHSSPAQVSATPFRAMMIPEHLYLFSEESARLLLQRSGLGSVVAEPPVFETDMILVAGRKPPRRVGWSEQEPLGERMRLVNTLLSLDETMTRERVQARDQIEALDVAYRTADRDRLERLQRAVELERLYQQADQDRTERQQQITELAALFKEADTDRVERQRQIDALDLRYREADGDRVERQRQIDALDRRYQEADRDRVERQRQIESLNLKYGQADRDRIERLARIGEIEALYKQADEDRTNRLRAIQELEGRLRKADDELIEQLRQIEQFEADQARLSERHERLRAVAADHRNSRVYKALVRLGRWRGFDQRLQAVLNESRSIVGPAPFEHTWTLPIMPPAGGNGAVAVDLTAILPGGENGGAKLVTLELISAMSQLDPARQFLLLTSATSHHEVAGLDAPNVRRRTVTMEPTAMSELLEQEPLSLLFCPMTASRFDDPRVPVVCLINDLQYLTYPEFFEEADRGTRAWAFSRAIASADHVVTPSQYVRASVLEHSKLRESQVSVIPHGFAAHRLPDATDTRVRETLERYGLEHRGYFMYPANFWPHKNHVMLLIAFGKFCRTRPDLNVRLVLTGAGRPDQRAVRENVSRMGLADRVILPGYVPDAELGALMSGALALVCPSLYEGYGMPIVEAFAARCPVACSNVTSLPEVAGDAAEYFDPRKPDDIARVLERLATCPALTDELRIRGEARLQQLESSAETARRYLTVIETVASRPRQPQQDQLGGVFTDGWTTSSLVVAHLGGTAEVRFELENPQSVEVTLEADGVEPFVLEPQRAVALRCVLPHAAGNVVIGVRPTFRPADVGQSPDTRRLGVRVRKCDLHRSGSVPVDLVAAMTDV